MKTLRNILIAGVASGLAAGLCLAAENAIVPVKVAPAINIDDAEPEKRFDLDFKGGPPRHLVETIEKASKTPLNAIIQEEHEGFFLPPLKLRNVTVPQLFEALTKASVKLETRLTGGHGMPQQMQHFNTAFGFKTANQPPRANSIWYFYVDSPPEPPQATAAAPKPYCRFWHLEPYLEKLKVEDITTAIETGWKMLGVNPLPKLSFHKDTKLLIVVGPQEQLSLIDDVLRELTGGRRSGQPTPAFSVPQIPRN